MDCSVNAQKFKELRGRAKPPNFIGIPSKRLLNKIRQKKKKSQFLVSSKRKKKAAMTNIAGLFVKTGHTMMPNYHIPCVHIGEDIIKGG